MSHFTSRKLTRFPAHLPASLKMAANKMYIPFLVKKELDCLAEDFINQWQSVDDRADRRKKVMDSSLIWLRDKDYHNNDEFEMLTEKLARRVQHTGQKHGDLTGFWFEDIMAVWDKAAGKWLHGGSCMQCACKNQLKC